MNIEKFFEFFINFILLLSIFIIYILGIYLFTISIIDCIYSNKNIATDKIKID